MALASPQPAARPRVCAIHQPNFFPWLGYFDKIRRADVFVFLDDVAYPKSGSGMGSWTNRVRIAIDGKPAWVRCPLRREHGTQPIRAVRIDDSQPWRRKLLRTLELNYGRSPGYVAAIDLLKPLIENSRDALADFNMNAIETIATALGLRCEFVRQSQLGVEGQATQLLIGLAKATGADTYLCGGGADGYQEDELFPAHGVRLVYQDFKAAPYGAPERFHPGLSVIDYLMSRDRRDWAALP
jgi:hypothetical protein